MGYPNAPPAAPSIDACLGVGMVGGVKAMILLLLVVAGCVSAPKVVPSTPEAAAIDRAIRKTTNKTTGELTESDLEKVMGLYLGGNQLTKLPKGLEKLTGLTRLDLDFNQLTDVTGLEKLMKLKFLWLNDNPDLTKAQIDELQKALPDCKIFHNAK